MKHNLIRLLGSWKTLICDKCAWMGIGIPAAGNRWFLIFFFAHCQGELARIHVESGQCSLRNGSRGRLP